MHRVRVGIGETASPTPSDCRFEVNRPSRKAPTTHRRDETERSQVPPIIPQNSRLSRNRVQGIMSWQSRLQHLIWIHAKCHNERRSCMGDLASALRLKGLAALKGATQHRGPANVAVLGHGHRRSVRGMDGTYIVRLRLHVRARPECYSPASGHASSPSSQHPPCLPMLHHMWRKKRSVATSENCLAPIAALCRPRESCSCRGRMSVETRLVGCQSVNTREEDKEYRDWHATCVVNGLNPSPATMSEAQRSQAIL